ncbi:MAG: 3-dehydroquinate synthase [Bacteroidetes bacterium]|nr:MAG: 3-dehydroquinate synthase [Bacteroidota bacterium]RLD95405.1 MAG: 3-dehydroquinate synthase [Bacteroidota bacterium]
MHQVQLTTPAGACEILVGELLSSRLQMLEQEPVLMIDENVLVQHHDLFEPFRSVIIPSGESYKTLQTVEALYRELVTLETDRSTLMVGVGGGLATDVAGFVASTFLRGTPFGFISTTLLGQVDASIGGKNGVNLDGYKNMVGNIRQPSFVWCDLSLLGTLENREYVSGIAEVIKYGLIWDIPFMDFLEESMEALLKQELSVLEHVVTTSAAIKTDVVQKDEKESDLRKILNFGHTIGHAIERHKGVLHGEAVAVGMVLAARLSHLQGLLTASEVDRVERLALSAGLPVRMKLDPEEIYQNIRKDKKKSGEDVHFVLLKGLGNTIIRPIPLPELKSIVYDLC